MQSMRETRFSKSKKEKIHFYGFVNAEIGTHQCSILSEKVWNVCRRPCEDFFTFPVFKFDLTPEAQ